MTVAKERKQALKSLRSLDEGTNIDDNITIWRANVLTSLYQLIMNWNSWDRSWLLKKKNIFIHCSSFFFFITLTYFVILDFVFQIIPGSSAGCAMLLFICLAFFYFHNAETSQCASMENQHTGIDSTLASVDRSVLAVDVRSVWTIFVPFLFFFFFLSLRKDM